jgi:hypothetical protein
MSDNKEENFEYEWTVENILSTDYYINQNTNIDSFWKCPWCDNETLNLEARECECWYRLDHNIPYKVKTNISNIKKESNNILNYKICTCWNKMWINSLMCKECYWRNKVNWNF